MSRIDIEAYEDEWEEDHHLLARRSRELSQAARARIDELDEGRVLGIDRGRVTILWDEEVVAARFAGTMRGEKAAVGDRIRVRPPKHDGDQARIVEVLPRESSLTRTADDDLDDERVVVANADQVVVVLAADYLEVGTRFLDRVMVGASVGHLDPVLCINKIDVLDDRAAAVEVAERYQAIDVEVCLTSAVTGEGVDVLAERLTGCWSAFAGHSGVGKSSLFNRIVPEAEHEVAEVGRYGGRHTTVAAWAMPVPSLDAWLVDTPGVRSFGLGGVEPHELARHFPELENLPCQLDDCIHDGEPGCALGEVEVHPARLASYRRLLASLSGIA